MSHPEARQANHQPGRQPAGRRSLVSRVAMTLAWLWHSTSSSAKYALPTFLQGGRAPRRMARAAGELVAGKGSRGTGLPGRAAGVNKSASCW